MTVGEKRADYLAYLHDWGLDEKTITEYRRFLFDYFPPEIGGKELYQLTLADRAKIIAAASTHGVHGPRRALSVFRQYCKFLKENDWWLNSSWDWRDIMLPKEHLTQMQYLRDEELEKVLNHLKLDTIAGLRTRAVIELQLATGLRIGEVCSLNKDSIDWGAKNLRVQNIKTGEWQTAFITDRAIWWMQEYISRRKDNDASLFISGRARLLSRTHRMTLLSLMRGVDVNKKVCSTIFRKTYTTGLVHKGVDIKSLQRLARHRSIRTTLRHYAVADDQKAEAEYRRIMGG